MGHHALLAAALACGMFCWCAAAATDASVQAAAAALFSNGTVPGWLKNIDNPLVRVAFPDAQRVYVELHPEQPGLSKTGPVVSQTDPSVIIPPMAVPTSATVPLSASVEAGPGAGLWRTPYPYAKPNITGPFNGTVGLEGASSIAMIYLRDGTVLFAERPHGAYFPQTPNPQNGVGPQANPLLVDVNPNSPTYGVGTLGSKYTVSYYNNQPAVPTAVQDTFAPIDVKSQPFCVGAAVDSLGNAIMVGGDVAMNMDLYRTVADRNAGFGYPNGYFDIRRYQLGDPHGWQIIADMFDVNSVTGQPNTALNCCIQQSTADPAVPNNCVPDANCSPRWYPTLLTLPSGNLLVFEGSVLAGYDVYNYQMNPTWQVLNVVSTALSYKTLIPSTAFTEQAPYSLYPLLFVLPHTGSILAIVGVNTMVLQMSGDTIVAQDRNYLFPPDLPYPVTYLILVANVLLPLYYPSYNPQVLLAGGSDLNGVGLPTSQLLTNLFPGVQASYVQENMGATRIEGVGIHLPDGTIFFCSGGAQGFDGGGGFGYGNTFTSFQTAPQIYNPLLPIGQRWSGLLTDSGIQRGYHNSAVLLASAEVMIAGSETTGEYRVQYYVPAYLLNGLPRPLITTAPCTLAYNTQFGVTYYIPSPGGAIAQVVLIRSASSTHSNQMDQRMVVLSTTVTSSAQLTALSPPDATVAPPGYYMLFLVSAAGVPSVATFVQLTAGGPASNVMVVGRTLPQDGALYSLAGNFFLTIQNDGNLVSYDSGRFELYGHTSPASLYSSNTYLVGSQPYTFTMRADCNAVLTDGTGTVTYSTNTGNLGGIYPCHLEMREDGTFAVVDAIARTLQVFGTPTTNGNNAVATLNSGRYLFQSYELFSADLSTFLIVQPDANLVLYNTVLTNNNGRTGAAAIYGSGTYNPNGNAPYYLVMQADCNLVLYDNTNKALYASGTYVPGGNAPNAVPPCRMVVGTGRFTIFDSKNTAIFTKP